jgi:hypothetical protein
MMTYLIMAWVSGIVTACVGIYWTSPSLRGSDMQ